MSHPSTIHHLHQLHELKAMGYTAEEAWNEFDDSSLLLSNTMRKKIMIILMMKVMMIIYDIVMTMMTLTVMMVMLAMAIMIRAMAMTILGSDDDVWTCRRQSLCALHLPTFRFFFPPHRFF